jgi:protease-4
MSKRPLAAGIALSLLIAVGFALGLMLMGKKSEEHSSLFADRLGVVEVKGVISDSSRAVEALDEFRRDSRIRAVVVRVDSPGGAVGPSQEIYQEIKRTSAAKPVVGSMGSVAASGGLYVAVACTKIVANPGTTTGSIGVISTIPNLQGLLDKIGVKVETIKTGALKATGQPDRPMTAEEKAMLQEMSKDLYAQFVGHVAQGRHLPVEKVREIADGGIFSGRRALELGLVDELGNFRDAVRLAARLGGIKGRPTLVKPEEKRDSWLSSLLKDEARAVLGDLLSEVEGAAGAGAGGAQYLYLPTSPAQ